MPTWLLIPRDMRNRKGYAITAFLIAYVLLGLVVDVAGLLALWAK